MKSGISKMLIALLISSLMIGGCGSRKTTEAEQPANQEVSEISEAAEDSAESVSDEADPETYVLQDSDVTVSESQEEEAFREIAQGIDEGFTYAGLSGMEFYFSSGAGGWATTMTIDSDGTFSGNYHDSDMGDTGDQYPNGTLYYCDFKGSFGELTRIDDYTYRTELKNIDFANDPDTEEYKDGVRYIYSTAYGLDDAADLYFYLPGKPANELPEAFISWVPMASETAENGNITLYGLYNEQAETGFGGYPAYGDTEDAAVDETSPEDALSEQIRAHVEEVQKQADELEYKLEHEDLSQTEMNQVSAELYTLWDDEINAVWQYLKGKLPEAEMKKLTDEERAWIKDKEAQIQKEGEQYEGGSIRPMAENSIGAKLTRERVYELLEYV